MPEVVDDDRELATAASELRQRLKSADVGEHLDHQSSGGDLADPTSHLPKRPPREIRLQRRDAHAAELARALTAAERLELRREGLARRVGEGHHGSDGVHRGGEPQQAGVTFPCLLSGHQDDPVDPLAEKTILELRHAELSTKALRCLAHPRHVEKLGAPQVGMGVDSHPRRGRPESRHASYSARLSGLSG
jgi:hypothetical protein